jgi:hypothetical protein
MFQKSEYPLKQKNKKFDNNSRTFGLVLAVGFSGLKTKKKQEHSKKLSS